MVNKFYTIGTYLALGAMGLGVGCSRIEPEPLPDLLNGYSSISERSTAELEKPKERVNFEIIDNKEAEIYQGERYNVEKLPDGSSNLYYTVRNINSEKLKGNLEKQLEGLVLSVDLNKEISSVSVKYKDGEGVEDAIKRTIERNDGKPVPQFMVVAEINRVFADFTQDENISLEAVVKNITDYGKAYVSGNIDLPGSTIRVPERAGFGAGYVVLIPTESRDYKLGINEIISQGITEDVARANLTVQQGKNARVDLIQERPYQDLVPSGGTFIPQTKYKETASFLEVTPEARENGQIFLKFSAGTATENPTGVLQVTAATRREVTNEGVVVNQGQTIVTGGFVEETVLAIERRSKILETILSPLQNIPFIGSGIRYLTRGKDTEKKKNMILFSMTPYYININSTTGESLSEDDLTTRTETESFNYELDLHQSIIL